MDPMEEMTLFLENLQKKSWLSYEDDIFQYILNFCSRSEIKGSQIIISNFPSFPLLVEIVEEIKYSLTFSTDIYTNGNEIKLNEKKVRDLIFTKIDSLFMTTVQGYFSIDPQTHLKNIIDLLRILNDMVSVTTYNTVNDIEHIKTHSTNLQLDFDLLFEQRLADITIKIDGKVLSLFFSPTKKSEYEFNLNWEKVIKDKDYMEGFLSDYNLHYIIEKTARNIKDTL